MVRKKVKDVTVKMGHLSGTPKEFTVPKDTTVQDLVDSLGFNLEGSDRVIDSHADEVNLDDEVKAGEEYTISSNLKARG